MNQILVRAGIIQIIFLVFFVILITILIRQSKALKYERRLGPFTLEPLDDDLSFFDKCYGYLWKLIKKMSSFLKRIPFVVKYSERYEKNITIEDKDFKSPIDYVTIKVYIVIVIDLLYIISVLCNIAMFSLYSLLFTSILSFFLLDIYLLYGYSYKRKIIEDDLLRAIIIMSNAFKSGKNVTQAVEIVIDELDGPIKDEFKKIYVDINYGLSLDVVFDRFYKRIKIDDARYLTSSLSLLNQTGGNIIQVFSMIEDSFVDKKRLRNELNSLTSSSVFVYRFLLCIPLFFVIVLSLLNPSYFSPLFHHIIGIVILSLIITLYILYVLIIRKLLKVSI